MPTQEERLATLEQSFGTPQKEIGKSIHEVNENSTIMQGLLQTLTQESKQTGLRMEMMKIRMDQLETKFDAHTALLNEHTRVLSEHTRVLSEHTTRFDRLETLLTQILARLPEKP
jgi:chromosome segregation ATPase